MLTQARLKEVLSYDQETGIFTWILTSSKKLKAGSIAGCLRKDGYIQIKIDANYYLAQRLAFLFMTGGFPIVSTDHINGIRNDNKWENLRNCTAQENIRNTPVYKNNKLCLKGVHFNKLRHKWYSQARLNGKKIHLGSFKTPELAYQAYQNFSIENHGNFLHKSIGEF